jgi:hypothetical protein
MHMCHLQQKNILQFYPQCEEEHKRNTCYSSIKLRFKWQNRLIFYNEVHTKDPNWTNLDFLKGVSCHFNWSQEE